MTRFLFLGILAAGLVFAQGGRGGGGMGGEGMGGTGTGMENREQGMGMSSMQRTSNRIDILATTLKLDKDQKKSVKNTLDEAQKEANPIHEQIVKSRLAVGEAIQEGKGQDEVNKLVAAQAALESQMAALELGTFAKIYKSLEQDQRNQTRTLFQMMKGIFDNKNWNNMQ